MTVSRKSWNPPGWPWELEFIVFCTMLLSVFFPTLLSYLGINGTPSLIGQTPGNGNPIAEQHQIVFSFGLISLYLVHLVMAVTTFSHLTTPITHMLSPLIFSAAAYQRTSAHVLAQNMDVPWFNGSTARGTRSFPASSTMSAGKRSGTAPRCFAFVPSSSRPSRISACSAGPSVTRS